MTTIKRQDAMAVLKEVMKTLNLELSVSDAEYMVPWTFCDEQLCKLGFQVPKVLEMMDILAL